MLVWENFFIKNNKDTSHSTRLESFRKILELDLHAKCLNNTRSEIKAHSVLLYYVYTISDKYENLSGVV